MEVVRFGWVFLRSWQNATIPWAGKDVTGLCHSGFPHFRWKHQDMSEHDMTVLLCNSLSQKWRWWQGNSRCTSTGGWWPQLPSQNLLPDICQSQGSDVPRHRTPFCSWLGFAPQQRVKPACPAPHPDGPLMSPAAFSGYSSVHQGPSFVLVLLFQLHVPSILVHSSMFPLCSAMQRSYQATEKGWLCDCVPPTPHISKQGPQSFLVHARPQISCPQYNELAVGQRIKGAATKSTLRELLQPARHSRQGPHISHGPWRPKRTFKPSDIESQPST